MVALDVTELGLPPVLWDGPYVFNWCSIQLPDSCSEHPHAYDSNYSDPDILARGATKGVGSPVLHGFVVVVVTVTGNCPHSQSGTDLFGLLADCGAKQTTRVMSWTSFLALLTGQSAKLIT